MKLFWVGLIGGLLVLPLTAFLYMRLGFIPVAATAPPLPLERYVARTALRLTINAEMPQSSPWMANEATFRAGVKIYREQCAICHGLPGHPQSAIAKGMFPPPPHLFEGHGVTDDPAGETYWKVRNGIRLTGMPAFGKSLSELQLWQVSEFLAKADKVPASILDELNEAPQAQKAPPQAKK